MSSPEKKQSASSKKKFALIGTSSSGKTTLTFDIVHKLKRAHVLVDGVFQQDRRLCFDRDKLEYDEFAQYAVLFKQIATESEMLLRDGTEVLVSDRSIVDFYAYYETMYRRNEELFRAVCWWAATYSALYYLAPLPYEDDGSRPPDDFRMAVDRQLVTIIDDVNASLIIKAIKADQPLSSPSDSLVCTQIHSLPRELIYQDILQQISRRLDKSDLDVISEILQRDVLIGGSYAFDRATKYSDLDIYVCGNEHLSEMPTLQLAVRDVLGVNTEVRQVTPKIFEYLQTQGFKLQKYEGW